MRLLYNNDGERVRLSPFFWCSIVAGIVLSAVIDGASSSSETFFQTSILYSVKNSGFSQKSFFMYVLFLRLSHMIGILILSTTMFRKLFLAIEVCILSVGLGAWIGAAITGYGLKGILLIVVGAFPHMLIYFFVIKFLITLLWERIEFNKQFLIAIFILFFAAIIGCIFESYVNPIFVAKLLKIF